MAFSVRRSPGLRTGLLLLPPMLWLGVAYLLALGALFVTSLWSQNDFTGEIERIWTLDNYRQIWEIPVYRTIAFRTIGIAALVTVVDAVIAFPIALFMAKIASPRGRRLLVIAVLMPLWASYLVKAYAWRGMFSQDGLIDWLGQPFGIQSPGYGLDRPRRSRWPTCGCPTWCCRSSPGWSACPTRCSRPPTTSGRAASPRCAGSCCRWPSRRSSPARSSRSRCRWATTSPSRSSAAPSQLLGNVIYVNVGSANNLPFAAALSTIPVVVMFLYLAAARRTGALENL